MAEVSDPQRDYYSRLLTSYQGRTLRRGARGKTVRALQLFLRDKGYDIAADGDYGRETEKAVRAWQKEQGLSQDGQAGRRTLTKAKESFTPTPRMRPSAPPAEPTEPLRGGPMGVPTEAPSAPPIGLGGARPVPRARPSFEPTAQVPRSRVVPSGPPTPGIAPTGLPDPLASVPTGVGANEAAFAAGQQNAPGGGISDVTSARMMPTPGAEAAGMTTGAAPGILSESFPVGAGGARPDPTRRPLPGAEPPLPPAPEGVPVASASPDPLAQALAGGGGMSAEMGGPPPPPPMPPPLSGSPMDVPPETAMQLAQLPPLNKGQFPMAPALPGGLQPPQGEMTPETIALIQALMRGEIPPDQSVPAF